MLKINLIKRLGKLDLQASLQLPNDGITVLFGLSGSGKSSLINLISDLLTPDHGNVQINDRTLLDTERGINVEQALERAGTKVGNKGFDCAENAIEMVNLINEIK